MFVIFGDADRAIKFDVSFCTRVLRFTKACGTSLWVLDAKVIGLLPFQVTTNILFFSLH